MYQRTQLSENAESEFEFGDIAPFNLQTMQVEMITRLRDLDVTTHNNTVLVSNLADYFAAQRVYVA